ncbi:MAG: hypothetical protein WA777_00760 [Rhodanobacter sp.]
MLALFPFLSLLERFDFLAPLVNLLMGAILHGPYMGLRGLTH